MKFFDYNEVKKHGSDNFPAEIYYVNSDHPQYIMPLHWHKEFEIIRVISGSFTVFLNGDKYILKAGDILIINGGTLHRGEPDRCIYECLVFDINMLKRQKNDIIGRYISPLIHGKMVCKCFISAEDSDLTDTIYSLFSVLSSKKPYYELNFYSLLFFMFSILYAKEYIITPDSINGTKQAQSVIVLLNWIDENFTETVTLKKLSEISGYSEKYICRIFKDYTSTSPINYINNLRIEKVCHEITVNKLSVTQAAYDCGFNDLSYFCRLFKSRKGITPTEYRNLYFNTEAFKPNDLI